MNCDNTFGLMTEMRGADAMEGVCWNGSKTRHGRRGRMLGVRLIADPRLIGAISPFHIAASCGRWARDIKRKRRAAAGVHHGTCSERKLAACFGAEFGGKIKRNDGEKVCQDRFPD